MKVLSLCETHGISGGISNPNFDLELAAKDGALTGLCLGIPFGLVLGGSIAYSAYFGLAANASYPLAIVVTVGLPVFSTAFCALFDTTLAYMQVPSQYLFY